MESNYCESASCTLEIEIKIRDWDRNTANFHTGGITCVVNILTMYVYSQLLELAELLDVIIHGMAQ